MLPYGAFRAGNGVVGKVNCVPATVVMTGCACAQQNAVITEAIHPRISTDIEFHYYTIFEPSLTSFEQPQQARF
jgi:hypothetical protein